MSFEWLTYKLDELCDFTNGFAFKSTDYVAKGNDTLEVFRMGYISRGGGYKEDTTPVFVPKNYGKDLTKYLLKSGDVVIAMTDMKDKVAILGNTAQIRHENRFVLNQRVGCIRVKRSDLLCPNFLYFYSNSALHITNLRSRANSGVQVNLSTAAIKESAIRIPPIAEQRVISGLLMALNDRINLIAETNLTLEAMAQALFKSWFVDFDPVCAKQEGRQSEGMDAEFAALFPDSFQQSEFGEIPKGWTIEALDKNINFLNGLALQKFPPTGINDLPVIKIAQLRKGDAIGADLAANSIKPEYVVKDGDVLFSWSGSLEVEIWCGGDGALNQHLFKVSSPVYQKWFFYLWTRKHLNEFRQIAASKATTMGHIQRSHLSAAKILVPDKRLLDAIDLIISPLIDKVIENNLQLRSLSSLRDTLLPRLISGQLSLPDAEEQIEAATV
jgi:type I restriction enzyme S subunit